MQILKSSTLFLLFATVLLMTSCEKDEPEVPNEEEVITTMIYTLTPTGAVGSSVELRFTDLDGDGGNDPVITSGTLVADAAYTGAIRLLNEQESPAEEITEEIEEEDEEHQFFFATSVAGLSVTYADEDADGNPIGLATTVQAGAAGSGTLTVTLRHEPSKSASGVAAGDIASAGGETDIEVTFDVTVQ